MFHQEIRGKKSILVTEIKFFSRWYLKNLVTTKRAFQKGFKGKKNRGQWVGHPCSRTSWCKTSTEAENVIVGYKKLTNWLFILRGLTICPTAESTWALSSSAVSFSMLSTLKLSRVFNCSEKIESIRKVKLHCFMPQHFQCIDI